ncbi:UNKNOWN [Stylonychia lemnae]|uniref:Uncharacterized protein n=1 Tax=Stylonychia lemnae TaxID=5949 RepID=A0A078A080_STYLE|nr:UNKNOWN [Stylonychia lemnae]|eukprot:CDW74188.1 UNKNOWN [Stylonychia lemnae]
MVTSQQNITIVLSRVRGVQSSRFLRKKCDVSQYCLVQLSNKDSKAILPHNTLITDLISPYKIEEFMIAKTQQYLYHQEKDETNSTCSPIRIIRSDVDNSLERLISSPAQTIYVQPSDENDEVVQLNQSCSESQMQMNTDRQHNRNNSKSSTKQSQKSNSKLNRKSKIMQQSVYQQNNKDQGVNQSTSNYLQNYITSNRQSHKKQPSSSSSNIIPITHFQVKKHSVNDTAFNYNGQIAPNQGQSNTGSTSTNTNTGGVNSLSRGNSMKKMKTFCNGSTGSNPAQTTSYQNQNTKPGSSLGQTSNHPQVSGFNKQTKKIVHKGGKSVNMYSTLNGQSQPQNALKKSQPKEAHRDMIKENFRDNAFVKIIQEDYNQTTRNEKTPAQSRQLVRENLVQSNQAKPHGSMKQSFTSNQDQALIFNKQHSQQHQQQTIQERPQINNLNEIFSDFLDEQSQIQSSSQTKGKIQSKVRAESLHSRQQVLLEEDSLENMKKLPEQYNHGYLQTEQYNSGLQDSQSISGNQATQRAIKHMAHKSMYALNSNQSRLGNQKKSLGQISQSGKNQNGQGQHFGTFDNSHAFYNHQYAITTMSECPNYDNLVLTENYNICNINPNTGANINDNMSSSKLNQQQHSLRLNTEMDITNKENINNQRENFDGLGKRGGTMGYTANVRSDSNPTKHRVRYHFIIKFYRIIDTVTSKMIY